jgi:soluble P-type ATPase
VIAINIPGYKEIEAEHLVLDYNGTLAIDGKLIKATRYLLNLLSHQLAIHILTADTFGTSKNELLAINCKLEILKPSLQDIQKEMYVLNLGKNNVIAIGNGLNDALMLKSASLGIVVMQKEGAAAKTLINADIVCNSILDALELLLNPLRIVATLRK